MTANSAYTAGMLDGYKRRKKRDDVSNQKAYLDGYAQGFRLYKLEQGKIEAAKNKR